MKDPLHVRAELGTVELERRATSLYECHELEGLLRAELSRASADRSAAAMLTALGRQLQCLQALAIELGIAATSEHVAEIAVERGPELLGATSCSFYVLEPDQQIVRITRTSVAATETGTHLRRIALTSVPYIADVMAAGAPLLLGSARLLAPRYPGHAALACQQTFGQGALALLPLVAEGGALGVLAATFGEAREFLEHERSVLSLFASHCSEALRRVRVVHQERQATRRAEEAARQAEEASRLKDEFLTTVSHELRTPLSAILGWSTLLRRERRATAASLDKGLEVIERNARAQQRIIEDILDVSQIVCGKFRIKSALVNLGTIANEVSDSLRSAASARNVELVMNASGGPHQMRGDADRLRQIVWNLLSNAVKFTPSGGTVKLQIARVGDEMAVTVRDTGDGIEPDFLPFVFQHFRQGDGTTKRVHGGLGLGLAMVRHLAEMHGGTVTAQSDGAGKGATFTVLLPMGTGL